MCARVIRLLGVFREQGGGCKGPTRLGGVTRKEGVAVFAVKTANHCSRPPLLQLLGTTHIPRCLPLSLSGSGPWGCKSFLLLRCSPVRSARVAARKAPTLLCSHGTCPSAVCCHTLISSRASIGLAQRHVSKRIFLTKLMHVIVQKFGLPLAPRRVQIVARGGVGKTLFKKKMSRAASSCICDSILV